ncbi:MAG: hypothetical protein JW910_05290, partial [Anaerolineae bacterium]|nr:hypothetical protein [Anaerolineae bacterium]
MTGRLVLFSDVKRLDRFALAGDDRLVPLTDAALDDLTARGLSDRLADLPDLGAIQTGSLAEAFDTAQAILAALEGDPAWKNWLLHYRAYDLRPMALKNLFFALEEPARLYRLAAAVAAAHPGVPAVLLDSDPTVRRAVGAAFERGVSQYAPTAGRMLGGMGRSVKDRALPLARFVRDRWQNWRADLPHDLGRAGRPVVCFLDAPHRARIMART